MATLVVVVGFGFLTPAGMRLDKLGRSIGGRAPTPNEAQELQRLSARVDFLSRLNLIFVLNCRVALTGGLALSRMF